MEEALSAQMRKFIKTTYLYLYTELTCIIDCFIFSRYLIQFRVTFSDILIVVVPTSLLPRYLPSSPSLKGLYQNTCILIVSFTLLLFSYVFTSLPLHHGDPFLISSFGILLFPVVLLLPFSVCIFSPP